MLTLMNLLVSVCCLVIGSKCCPVHQTLFAVIGPNCSLVHQSVFTVKFFIQSAFQSTNPSSCLCYWFKLLSSPPIIVRCPHCWIGVLLSNPPLSIQFWCSVPLQRFFCVVFPPHMSCLRSVKTLWRFLFVSQPLYMHGITYTLALTIDVAAS